MSLCFTPFCMLYSFLSLCFTSTRFLFTFRDGDSTSHFPGQPVSVLHNPYSCVSLKNIFLLFLCYIFNIYKLLIFICFHHNLILLLFQQKIGKLVQSLVLKYFISLCFKKKATKVLSDILSVFAGMEVQQCILFKRIQQQT